MPGPLLCSARNCCGKSRAPRACESLPIAGSRWRGVVRMPLTVSRMLVGAGGVALAIQGARFRTWQGNLLAAVGGSVAVWALTGEGDLSAIGQWLNGIRERVKPSRQDSVHDASADSFPASDPPAWTTTGAGIRKPMPVR